MSAALFPDRRLKFAASINDEALSESTDSDFELAYIDIGNVDSQGRIHDIINYRFGVAPSRARRIVRDGDVIISTVRTYLQAIAPVENPPDNLIVSTGFAVIRPSNLLDHRFCKYALRANKFLWEVESRSTGVSYPAINASDLGDIKVSLPEIGTQRLIANYLDRETARIDGLIAEKERMLTLLEEKRAALISRVVTRGLDPNAPLKPSGQEWLGKIPAHWQVLRLKFATSGIDQGASPQCYSYPAAPGEWGVLKTGCVNGGEFREQENKALPDENESLPEIEVRQGDVLMSRASGSVDLIGSVAHVSSQPAARLMLSDKIFRFRVREDVLNPRYLVLAMGARYLRHQIKSVISGAEGLANNIAKSDVMELLLVVPPILEQRRIVEDLDRAISSSKVLCGSLGESITLAKERRAALITAAVTGQIPQEEMRA
ncbi:MAG: restriction endonuclease subunit S [Betaproteobacteria bacterium]|nr:restriction endonuclease subunit S [Betaproteobacteria bacterium]